MAIQVLVPLPKSDKRKLVVFLSIAKAMVYHRRKVYIITRSVYPISHRLHSAFAMRIYNSCGIDGMQDFVLMIYTALL